MGAFDKIVAAVSPRRACEREAWRQQLEILRGYDAAGYGRLNAGWRVHNESAEVTDRFSRDVVRARARDLERNSDIAQSILVHIYSRTVRKIFQIIEKECGGVDILINNAGIAWFGLLTDMTDNDWDKILATNLSSVFYCSRAAIPYMVSKKCGKILNISSMWGTVGASCEVAYSATKSGIHGLTRALAKELAPSNIQVNAIACGVIDTEMNGRLNEEERQDLMDEIPSGRFADPEEVAELALKLTDTPAYMTGQIIGIDGGFI